MNRTGIFLTSAAGLALVAIAVGLPRWSGLGATDGADGAKPAPATPVASASWGTPGSLSMTTRLSHPFVGLGRQDVFVTVDLHGAEVPGAQRAPVNLAIVIDRSGSMAGQKLEQAKQAARQLVSELSPRDRLAIVHYGSDVKLLDGLPATPENKARMLAFIDGIWDEGGTNIGAALAAARDALVKAKSDTGVSRLVLVSDGQPTEGVTELAALTQLVSSIRALGVSISSLGVGADFNERLMTAIAEVGAGAYGYLEDAAQLSTVFQKDLAAASTQVARRVSVTFRVPAGVRLERVLGYSQVTRRPVGAEALVTVTLPDFAAGQTERLVAHLEVEANADGQPVAVSAVELAYHDVLQGAERRAGSTLTAMATADARVVSARRDKDAVVLAARARAAANAEAAAERLAAGDSAAAQALLRSNRALYQDAALVAGPAALADDVKGLDAQLEDAQRATTDDELKSLRKAINVKARRDYGQVGSTY